jgi:hypothetical protein
LGISAVRPAADTDWTAALHRLDQLGATSIHRDKLPQGGCRLSCLLPTGQPGRTHRIDAQAASDAEALRLALEKAEEWARRR